MEVTNDAIMLSFSSDSDGTLEIDASLSDAYALGQSALSEAKPVDLSKRDSVFLARALKEICR